MNTPALCNFTRKCKKCSIFFLILWSSYFISNQHYDVFPDRLNNCAVILYSSDKGILQGKLIIFWIMNCFQTLRHIKIIPFLDTQLYHHKEQLRHNIDIKQVSRIKNKLSRHKANKISFCFRWSKLSHVNIVGTKNKSWNDKYWRIESGT